MGSAPPGHWKSLCITHLPTCPNQNSPTDSADEAEYARDNPDREDVAESILPYFAVRYRPDRLSDADRAAITYAIPNRLVYFDDAGLDMAPYTPSTVAPVPGSLRSSPSTVPLLRPFEAPIPVR